MYLAFNTKRVTGQITMEKISLIMLITVLTGFCRPAGSFEEYHFINVAKTFYDAQAYCRNVYSDLAIVHNLEGVNNLLATVTNGFTGLAWIGAYKQAAWDWHWSLSKDGFYQQGETTYRNWYIGEPNNVGGIENCCVIGTDGRFWDVPCDSYPRYFVCYDDKPQPRYIMINHTMTWRQAQSYCRQNYVDLASFRNAQEDKAVTQVLTVNTAYFVGLFKDNIMWSDKSTSSFRYWNSNEPNSASELCVAVYVQAKGQWVDLTCSVKLPFFCYSARRRIIMKLELQSDQDMNTPTVADALWAQIQQKLYEVAPNSTMTWRVQPDRNVFWKKWTPMTLPCKNN